MVAAMSPRMSAAGAGRTRERILTRSVAIASVEGLDGLTLGRLAADLSMSKAGVIGHFGTKEALQLATLDKGYEFFTAIAFEPAEQVDTGLPRVVRCPSRGALLTTRFFLRPSALGTGFVAVEQASL